MNPMPAKTKQVARNVNSTKSDASSLFSSGFRCDSLRMLAKASDRLNDLMTVGAINGDDLSAEPISWFHRVDQALRRPASPEEVIPYAQSMSALMACEDWTLFKGALAADASMASELRREQGQLRSLWGVTPIINLIQGVEAERSIGHHAESLVFTTYHTTAAFDIKLGAQAGAIGAADPSAIMGFYWLVLVWAMVSYDTVFYFNDRGILPPNEATGHLTMGIRREELLILRRANKLIYTLPYGADYRTRERTMARSKFNFCMDCPEIGKFCFCNSDVWDIVFHSTKAFATSMLSSGLATDQMPGSRRLEHVVVDIKSIEPNFPKARNGRNLRILHIPNHPHFKGTRYYRDAREQLGAGAPIEFIEETGVSNERAHELMHEADVVLDQLIGGYFGMTALEAMAHGKPVISYIVDQSIVLAPDECPVINANPDTILDVLKGLIDGQYPLEDIGRRSREYVERYYSVEALAERLRILFRDTASLETPTPNQAQN
jgi:glycosyltransferase involved in cell wall biosynthesis